VVGKNRVTSDKRAALWSPDAGTEHTAVGVGRARFRSAIREREFAVAVEGPPPPFQGSSASTLMGSVETAASSPMRKRASGVR
jgi:hypothetical protein